MKRIRTTIRWIVWTIISLYIVTIVLLHIPAVQGSIGSKIADLASEKLGTEVRIGHIDLGFLNRVIIDDLLIYDQHHKKMLSASRIGAKVDLIPLLQSGAINISSAQLFGLKADLYKTTKDSKPNYQFVLDSLASKDQSNKKPLHLSINSLVIRNGSIRYNQYDAPQTPHRFNPHHLDITNISTHIVLDKLDEKGMHDCLRLIHFHIGSQITKIRRIQTALTEAAQYYANLRKMGYNVDFVDCGGGLGVDYDGTRSSSSESSVNYSIQEYVNDCVSTFVDAANKHGIPHPNIITESGRNVAAHHSILVINVLETASLPEMSEEFEAKDTDHQLVRELYKIWDNINSRNMLEDWHDAEQIREESLELFSHGLVDLKTRAEIEAMYWSVCHEINTLAKGMKHVPDELRNLDKLLADKYFCNFSLFQSLPDSWAIDQLFPVMPIQRLNERPTRKATLQDITCDSDGKISNFVTGGRTSHVLPIHSLRRNEPYYLGVFLVGAYQEILGDLHNLFGDTNAVHLSVKDGSYHIDQIIDGETVEEVLEYVQYNPKKLVRQLEIWVTKSVKQGKISLEEGKEFLNNYRSGLYGYTYLE